MKPTAAPSSPFPTSSSAAAALRAGAGVLQAPDKPIDIEVGHADGGVYVSLSRLTEGLAMTPAQAEHVAAALRTHAGLARKGQSATAGNTRIR